MSDRLDTYRAKRDFPRTAEPQDGVSPMDKPSLMVHKHAARRLHYDFRLEVDGVMPSWAVPKGPPTTPRRSTAAPRPSATPPERMICAHGLTYTY